MSAPNPQAQPRYYTICAFSRVFHYWNLRISSRARIGSRSRGRFNSARKSGAHLLAAEIRERKRHGHHIAGYKSFHASSSSAEVQSGPQVLEPRAKWNSLITEDWRSFKNFKKSQTSRRISSGALSISERTVCKLIYVFLMHPGMVFQLILNLQLFPADERLCGVHYLRALAHYTGMPTSSLASLGISRCRVGPSAGCSSGEPRPWNTVERRSRKNPGYPSPHA